jgi:hypothetical protein
MATATNGQPVKQFPAPAYVNKEEVPQPEPTIQETQQPTEQPTTASPTPTTETPKPARTRIKPKWTRQPLPSATQSSSDPQGGKAPRWRRTPSGTPTGGDG